MKIRTTISMDIEKANGEEVVLERSIVSHHGDNPAFERGEATGALQVALSQFIEAQALAGTRPL